MILKQKRLEPLRFKPLAEDLGRSSDLLLNFGGVAGFELAYYMKYKSII